MTFLKVLFDKCIDAINFANTTQCFGCFYSSKHDINQDIHLHECCEILFCLSDGKSFFIDDKIYDVLSNDVFVINPFEAHKITSEEFSKFKRYVLHIHPTFLYANSTAESSLAHCFDHRSKNTSNRLSLNDDESAVLTDLFEKLSKNYEFGDDIIKTAAVLEILAVINKHFIEKNAEYKYSNKSNNQTLIAALKYINDNLSQELTIDKVAESCFVSTVTLTSLFKRCMGISPAKYITSKRMTVAKKLLKNGESVVASAEKCGYCDYTSFIRAFKRITGTSPGRFMRQ